MAKRNDHGRTRQEKPSKKTIRKSTTPTLASQEELLRQPGIMNPQTLLAIQQTAGNQVARQMVTPPVVQRALTLPNWLKKKPKTTPQEFGTFAGNARSSSNLNDKPDVQDEVDSDKTAKSTSEGLGFASDTSSFLGDLASGLSDEFHTREEAEVFRDFLKEKGLSSNTNPENLSKSQKEEWKEYKEENEGEGIGSDSDRAGMEIAGSAIGTLSGVGTGLAGFVAMVISIKNMTNSTNDKWDRTSSGIDALEQGTQGVMGFGSAAASASSTIAGGIATTGSKAAETANDISAGIGESFGMISTGVSTLTNLAQVVLKSIKYVMSIKEEGWKQGETIKEIVGHFLQAGKNFLSTANSVVKTLHTFLDLAGKAGELTNVVPIVGAAVNIAIQMIDILMQVIETVTQVIKMVKAKLRVKEMLAMLANATGEKARFIKKVIEVNQKRFKRAWIPLTSAVTTGVADVISISGSILNIVGAATSAAYGAGLGLMVGGYAASGIAGGMKLGAATASPIATGIRSAKQFIRDAGAKEVKAGQKPGKMKQFAQWTGGKLGIDMTKTTAWKNQDYAENAVNYIKMLKSLPASYQGNEAAYLEHYRMLKATGINTKELFAKTDVNEQVQLIIKAMKRRS